MGEDACYLPLVEVDGRVREAPVISWPLDGEQEPPPGRRLVIETAEQSESRLQFLENLAREDRLVLLYAAENRETAELVAGLVLERLKKK